MELGHLEKPETYTAQKSGKFLLFNLDENSYGISILKVSEIIGITTITAIPKVPQFMKGVINLRGKIIPVIDLRIKFGMPERSYDKNTCIIIINLNVENLSKQIGVVVDIVSEVCDIDSSNIEEPPSYGNENGSDNNFLSGIGKIKENVVMLLDIDRTIFSEEILHIIKNVDEDLV